jgi:LuxR family transcriptional regulator, maltose regulon positive regulatory protein
MSEPTLPLLGVSDPALSSEFLLLPKLSPPRSPGTLVTRERLMAQLDQALTHELTLLSASAGFGKTTLLSAWVAHCPCPVAWLSLEEQDNHPTPFWSYVIAALRTTEPTVGETALSMLHAPQPPTLMTILTTLINDLVAGQEELVLVLDDYHVIDDPAIASSFQFLLSHLPSRLHLILAGRADPPLALPRLRARGQVAEIRDRDLRFTRTEAASFFTSAMKLSLAEADLDVLEQRAEGWIAGLQLAALAMRTHSDSSAFVQHLSGSQRFILDYMQDEVLEGQPQEVQDFLLHTAILARLHASLCQAVTLGTSPQESLQMLLALEKANLFLVPLDEERRWYRLHGLFRDVLQARLQALSPQLIPILHQRAAHWYAQQGDVCEAIAHALTGNDYDFALALMEQFSEQMYLNGETTLLHAWSKQLPNAVLLAHGRLALTTSLQLLFQTFYAPDEQWNQAVARAEYIIARLESLLQSQEALALPAQEQRVLHNRLGLLRAWIATRAAHLQRDIAQEIRLGFEMQELAKEEDVVWKMLPAFTLDVRETLPDVRISILSDLKQQAEREQHQYEVAWITHLLGWNYREAGQPRRAYQLHKEALYYLQQMGKARSMFGYTQLALADLHWLRNELVEAQAYIQAVLQFARTWQHVDMQIIGYCHLIAVLLALGQQVEAKQVLGELEGLIDQNSWNSRRTMVIGARVHVWLAQGNLAAASAWAARSKIDPQIPGFISYQAYADYYEEAMALVRIYLALQRNSEALHLLTSLLTHTEHYRSTWDRVPVLALQVVALHASGESVQARQAALRLLQLADPADYLRIYLDAGAPMQQVLQSLLSLASTDPAYASVPVPLASLRNLLATFEQQERQATSTEHSSPSLPSPLTARELEVLHLLAQGKTNQEIAAQLVVSLATAKKHVANILGKLEAENRVQAIAHAREHKLLY